MLWVGQFSLVDGQAREESPWMGVYPGRGPGDGESMDLYLVVEPALPGSEEYCADLSAAIGSVFQQWKLSFTGGLLRALTSAHQHLREWNRKSLKEHRVAAGVSCLALRPGRPASEQGSEAYLAQVAPAAALLLHDDALQRLEPTLPDALEPLGLHEEFWPHFSRLERTEGDRLLLLSPSLAQFLPPAAWLEVLQQPPQDILPALYRRLQPSQERQLLNCGALLVASLPGPPS